MLGLVLRLDCRQELSQLPITTSNSFQTIFPMIEAWLSYDDHLKAVQYMAKKKNSAPYRSIIDFLFAETFGGQEKKDCLNYYHNEGPKLKDLYSEARRRWYEHVVLGVCVAAYDAFNKDRQASWCYAVQQGKSMVLSPKPKG